MQLDSYCLRCDRWYAGPDEGCPECDRDIPDITSARNVFVPPPPEYSQEDPDHD